MSLKTIAITLALAGGATDNRVRGGVRTAAAAEGKAAARRALAGPARVRSLGIIVRRGPRRARHPGGVCRGFTDSGLSNMKECFFQLCQIALGEGANVSFETVRWHARAPARPPFPKIAHERLWDVPHWNEYVSKHGGLPYLVPGPPTSVRTGITFDNHLFLNTYRRPETQTPASALRVAHFHRALRPARDILDAAAAAKPQKPYGAVHLRLEKDLDLYPWHKSNRLGAKTTFDAMENATSLRTCAEGVERLFVACALDEVSNAEDKALLATKRGPFDSALAFHDDGLSARFGDAAYVVGAMIDTEICADAEYFVGYAGLSTFDRALIDVFATRDQWTERRAEPGPCTFSIRHVWRNESTSTLSHGSLVGRDDLPNGVHVRHYTSLP